MATTVSGTKRATWYWELDVHHWQVLATSFRGWILDGYETYALFVVRVPALRQLLDAAELYWYAGIFVAATLFDWAMGAEASSPIIWAETDDDDYNPLVRHPYRPHRVRPYVHSDCAVSLLDGYRPGW